MKDRIKEVRKKSGLNQTDFGNKLGLAQTTIAGYENGSRTVPASAILSICREFNVSETWLRTGLGDMFTAKSRSEEMAQLVQNLLSDRPDSFRSALIATLLRLDPDGPEWAAIERIYSGIAAEQKKYQEP